MESLKEIEKRAAELLARRDGDSWTPEDEEYLRQWVSCSTAHRVAVLRLEASWEEARRLRALSAGLASGVIPARGEWRHSPFFERSQRQREPAGTYEASAHSEVNSLNEDTLRISSWSLSGPPARPQTRRWRWLIGVAATVLLAVGILVARWTLSSGPRYATSIGQIVTVPLSDGSRLTLNTASTVRVTMRARERRIRLIEGEAFFEVAKDPRRPFVVEIGDERVIAVGTQFSVRRTGDDIRVVVAEGTVRIASAGMDRSGVSLTPTQSSQDVGSSDVLLPAGSIASAGDSGIVVKKESSQQVQESLTWRKGYLSFHQTTLAEAVAEFNRYNARLIRIDDPALRAIRINGVFRASNYEAFVRILDEGFHIRATNTDDAIILTQN